MGWVRSTRCPKDPLSCMVVCRVHICRSTTRLPQIQCTVHKYKGKEPPRSSPHLSPPHDYSFFPLSLTQAFDPAEVLRGRQQRTYSTEEHQFIPLKHRTAWRSHQYTKKTTPKTIPSPLARGRQKTSKMYRIGNIYFIAATAVIGGALFGFDISVCPFPDRHVLECSRMCHFRIRSR